MIHFSKLFFPAMCSLTAVMIISSLFVCGAVQAQTPSDFHLEGIAGGRAPWETVNKLTIDSAGNGKYYIMYAPDRPNGVFTLVRSFTLTGAQLNFIYSSITSHNFFGLSSHYDGDVNDGTFINLHIRANAVEKNVYSKNTTVPNLDAIVIDINTTTPDTLDLNYNEILPPEEAFSESEVTATGQGTTVTRDVCKLTVTMNIDLTGGNAAIAAAMKKSIEAKWNGPGLTSNWCPVVFVANVNVGVVKANNHQIDLVNDADHRSYVNNPLSAPNGGGHSTGKWKSNAGNDNTAAHESGHLMGLDDQYKDDSTGVSRPNPGHQNDVMASLHKGGTPAIPTQAEIDQIITAGGVSCPLFCCLYVPTDIFFPSCLVTTTCPTTLLANNRDTTRPMIILNVFSTNTAFTISPPNANIPPGGSQPFNVQFHPTAITGYGGYFVFQRFDGVSTHVDSIPVNGFGTGVATVSGIMYEDVNGNGIKDLGEPAVANQAVQASQVDSTNPELPSLAIRGTTTTNGSGNYSMQVTLFSGASMMKIEHNGAWQNSFQTQPGNNAYLLTLHNSDVVTTKDFGLFRPGSISGHVFNDYDQNGVQNGGEPSLAGEQVLLLHTSLAPKIAHRSVAATLSKDGQVYVLGGEAAIHLGDSIKVNGVPRIEPEILSMNLVSANPIRVTLDLDLAKRTFGSLLGLGSTSFPAQSKFDLFPRLTIPSQGSFTTYTNSAVRISGIMSGAGQVAGPNPFVYPKTGCELLFDNGFPSGEICSLQVYLGYYLKYGDTVPTQGDSVRTYTDANGNFTFAGLPAGTFCVDIILKEDWIIITPPESCRVLTSGLDLCCDSIGIKLPLEPPPYDPSVWNGDSSNQAKNNCYNYGTNKHTNTFAQPGRKAGYPPLNSASMNCDSLKARVMADGLVPIPPGGECNNGFKIALVFGDTKDEVYVDGQWITIETGHDYHWYRKGLNGKWSHKPGGGKATDKDASGNDITNPATADRKKVKTYPATGDLKDAGADSIRFTVDYTTFCDSFCITKITDVAEPPPPTAFLDGSKFNEQSTMSSYEGNRKGGILPSASGTIMSTWLISSGLPDPTLTYSGADVDSIVSKISGLTLAPDPVWRGDVGYQGVHLVGSGVSGFPISVHVWNGIVQKNIGGLITYYLDDKGLEGMLLGDFILSITGPVTTLSFNTSWNMISNPLIVANDSVKVLYPSAASNAFHYVKDVGYQVRSRLDTGVGYWLKFSGPTTVHHFGMPLNNVTIGVDTGWNMIGSAASPVSVGSIIQSPPGNVSSSYFGYGTGYVVSDSIVPGKSYWVKVNRTGTLKLSGGPNNQNKKNSVSGVLKELNGLTLSDAYGGVQQLFFGTKPQNAPPAEYFAMPPLPPDRIFTASFLPGHMVAYLSGKKQENISLDLSSPHYPVNIQWSIKQHLDVSLQIDDEKVSMSTEGSYTLTKPFSHLGIVVTGSGGAEIPKEYALYQNYPNPFNPSTKIEFDLPHSSVVSIQVYNMLGQRVATLADHLEFEAGKQVILFNASSYPSGAYIYRLQANGYVDSKVMLLMK